MTKKTTKTTTKKKKTRRAWTAAERAAFAEKMKAARAAAAKKRGAKKPSAKSPNTSGRRATTKNRIDRSAPHRANKNAPMTMERASLILCGLAPSTPEEHDEAERIINTSTSPIAKRTKAFIAMHGTAPAKPRATNPPNDEKPMALHEFAYGHTIGVEKDGNGYRVSHSSPNGFYTQKYATAVEANADANARKKDVSDRLKAAADAKRAAAKTANPPVKPDDAANDVMSWREAPPVREGEAIAYGETPSGAMIARLHDRSAGTFRFAWFHWTKGTGRTWFNGYPSGRIGRWSKPIKP